MDSLPLDTAPKRSKMRVRCCVFDCSNSSQNSPGVAFYRFPSDSKFYPLKALRRKKWLNLVRLQNPDDGSEWMPTNSSRICSAHFIGNKKSEDPLSPAYNPSIFADIYKVRKCDEKSVIDRYKRKLKREMQPEEFQVKKHKTDDVIHEDEVVSESFSTSCNTADAIDCNYENCDKKYVDKESQVDFIDTSEYVQKIFFCNLYTTATSNEAQCQANGPAPNKKIIIQLPAKEDSDDTGFFGFRSIKHRQQLIDLCGTSMEVFNLLLKVLLQNKMDVTEHQELKKKISVENKLFIFLMKMKSGQSFAALSVLFCVNRTSISRLFYSTLKLLSQACKNFVFWPEREVIKKTMPEVFKPDYKNCRVIIDATEFVVEQPSTIEQRVKFYSHYKKGYRVKVVIGCSPCGLITLVSKCYGGRATDAQITISSGLLDLLQPGDVVLADKGFPQIKTLLDESGRNILLMMPPFKHDEYFTEEEVNSTFSVAKVRVHIERIMQRIRVYKIVDNFSTEMLPYCDQIIFMCCVLVNLQPPIIQEKKRNFVSTS